MENYLYIFIWYLTNYYYYYYNKKLLNENNNVSIISSYQLGIGVFFSIIKYILINYKKIYLEKIIFEIKLTYKNLFRLGLYNYSCHYISIYFLSFTDISFTQVIKSLEPLFNVSIGYIFYSEKISQKKFISLIPIILSALFSSINIKNNIFIFEYSYKSLFFGLFFLSYAIIKSYETKKIFTKININNDKDLFAIYYILINFYSYFISLIFGIIFYRKIYFDFLILCYENNNIRNYLILSGVTFYLYNEISTLILVKTTHFFQITLNIVKRNFVIFISYIIFKEDISIFKIIGFVLSFFGLFLDK